MTQYGAMLTALVGLRNDDGGIPAGNDGDESGPWTTAATVQALCLSPSPLPEATQRALPDMATYLVESSVKSGGLASWPIVTGPSSTMATGAVIRALELARASMESLDTPQLNDAISGGREWLRTNQVHANGGWCAGENSDTPEDARVLATVHAIEGLKDDVSPARPLRLAQDFLLRQQDQHDGGWRDPSTVGRRATATTVSDTARAIIALVEYLGLSPESSAIKRGIEYLERQYGVDQGRRTQKVSLRLRRSPAEVVINNNTICDLVGALAAAKAFRSSAYRECLSFLSRTVDDTNRLWPLSDPEHIEPIYTWPSADWLLAIQRASHCDSKTLDRRVGEIRISRATRLSGWIALLAAIVISLVIFRHSWQHGWDSLPEATRSIILVGGVLALGVGFVAAAAWDATKMMFSRFTTGRRNR
jgi:hypothetical protein